jgi:hypothetical protein
MQIAYLIVILKATLMFVISIFRALSQS